MYEKGWTEEEDLFLKNYYATHSTFEIAEELGRSYDSVRIRARRLGVYKERRQLNEKGEQQCRTCGRWLKADEHFYENKTQSTGYAPDCFFCMSKEQKEIRKLEAMKQEDARKIFVCSTCNQEKYGYEFAWVAARKKRTAMCLVCASKRGAERRVKKIKEGEHW